MAKIKRKKIKSHHARIKKVRRKRLLFRTKGNTSLNLLLGLLLVGLLGGSILVANSLNTAGKLEESAANVEYTEKAERQLRLETFWLSPTVSETRVNTDSGNWLDYDSGPPGIYPTYPATPYPTLIISDSGCTYTIGFWKNHAGFGPQSDAVSPLLPVWLGTPNGPKSVKVSDTRKAVELLQKSGDASNGINKMYAQGLGSKLNIKSGAPGQNLSLTEADEFLSQHNASDWTSLDSTQQTQVLRWATDYDEFNNGRFGPPHCP